MTRTIACPCGASTTTECSFAADCMEGTLAGFKAVGNHQGHMTYLCPPCSKRALDLARELYAIVGDRRMYLPSLLPKEPAPWEKLRIAEPALQRVAVDEAEETEDAEVEPQERRRMTIKQMPGHVGDALRAAMELATPAAGLTKDDRNALRAAALCRLSYGDALERLRALWLVDQEAQLTTLGRAVLRLLPEEP